MPSISGYHHLSLSVTDLGKSTQWYHEVLGFATDAEFAVPGFAGYDSAVRMPT